VVASCLVCHDLKDRIPLKLWDLQAMHEAFDELFMDKVSAMRNLPRPEAFERLNASLADLESKWSELSPLARVLLAKFRSVHEDEIYLNHMESASCNQAARLTAP
jgi:hypothetical protein